MKKTIYFVSDAHLGIDMPGHNDREAAMLSFFDSLAPGADELYIVGDLFDFWIEYRHAIRPEYFRVIDRLFSLVKSGTRVHYLAGNHDFALGPFLSDTLGLIIHPDHYETTIQGKRVHLFHGDGLFKRDVGYRFMRRILRNKTFQGLYKLLPPDIGVPLASFCSGSSRKMLDFWFTEEVIEEYRQHARTYLDHGADIVVFGHTHHAEIRRWGDKTYVNTGEWIRTFNYAKLENGAMSLWQWFTDKAAREILS
jgi:UDP-2,3-diacylglucosamine hydrolase